MAYPISKQKFGNYVLIQFKSDGLKNNEFSVNLEHNPNILRHMIISIDESEIKEQSEDIKEQITGLTRPASALTEENTDDKKEVEVVEKKENVAEENILEKNIDEAITQEEAPSEKLAETTKTTEE